MACIEAALRFSTPSFSKTRARCTFTVFSAQPRMPAMSEFDLPWASGARKACQLSQRREGRHPLLRSGSHPRCRTRRAGNSPTEIAAQCLARRLGGWRTEVLEHDGLKESPSRIPTRW